jgi:hypothetical protein
MSDVLRDDARIDRASAKMTTISDHIAAIFDVTSGTMMLFCFISSVAVWLIRNSLSSSLAMVMIFPLVLGLSLIANYSCLSLGLYDPKKMADWLIWTIFSATAGALVGIGSIAAMAQLSDNKANKIA